MASITTVAWPHKHDDDTPKAMEVVVGGAGAHGRASAQGARRVTASVHTDTWAEYASILDAFGRPAVKALERQEVGGGWFTVACMSDPAMIVCLDIFSPSDDYAGSKDEAIGAHDRAMAAFDRELDADEIAAAAAGGA